MKVNDLTGPLLDYWAGKAAGKQVLFENNMAQVLWRKVGKHEFYQQYSPSTRWEEGGPLLQGLLASGWWQIEQFGAVHDGIVIRNFSDEYGDGDTTPLYGHTMPLMGFQSALVLVAACRALVFSVYGEDVPDTVDA